MEIGELKRILTAFADEPGQVDVQKGRIVVQLQDELIDACMVRDADTGISVIENGVKTTARKWLLSRVARLPQLADRILSYTSPTEAFVNPCGRVTPDLAKGQESDESVPDVLLALETALGEPIQAQTSVIYLTSDAGEGKTTLINQLARRQAGRFKERQSSWLLVPIPLGGKAFLRFDDVVIATLVNRLRFNYYFYDGFLELVRLGAVVPAFDGFEEMFVEGHSGEAVSALGGLIEALESQGTVLVAARKAFFEYSSFKTQAKLFDSIGSQVASFSRVKIERWGKNQFLTYGRLRGSNQGEEIFDLVSQKLGSFDHPLLTRAVLVRRLFDVATSLAATESLLAKLGTKPQDYFFNFVDAIVKREASEKWLDKTGEAKEPLLQLSEHHELLAAIAREMWQSSSHSLRSDVVEVLVDLLFEQRKSPSLLRQIKERIKSHSLLTIDVSKGSALAFDHDDFRRFYLGEALGRALVELARGDLYPILATDQLPTETCDQAIQFVGRAGAARGDIVKLLSDVARTEPAVSFAKENCGALIVRLGDGHSLGPSATVVERVTFPLNSLFGRELTNFEFRNCYFMPTKISGVGMNGTKFIECEFERIEVPPESDMGELAFQTCRFLGLIDESDDTQHFGPLEISAVLVKHGATVNGASARPEASSSRSTIEEAVKLTERFLRIFLRSTQVNEDVILTRLGRAQATAFVDEILPQLVRAGVVEEIPYLGRGVQRRFKLTVPMRALQAALAKCNGRFDEFLTAIATAVH